MTSSRGVRSGGCVLAGVMVLATTPALASHDTRAASAPTWGGITFREVAGLSPPTSGLRALPAKVTKRGLIYAGSTSQGDPIVMQLAGDGKRLTRIVPEWEAQCQGGGVMPYSHPAPVSIKVPASGSFSMRGKDTGQYPNGWVVNVSQTIKAKVKGLSMSGSWHAVADIVDATGKPIDHCTTSFTYKAASAKGHIFGGTTSQDLPVAVELAKGNKKVEHFHIGWRGSCSGGDVQWGDTWAQLAIRKGRFGGDWILVDTNDQTGEKATYDISLPGKISGAKASGTFKLQVTYADANGAQTDACQTAGRIAWKANSG